MANEIDLGIEGLSDYQEIGSGGFATVYSAVEVGTRRRVAVKVMATVDDSGRRRFDREQVTMGQTGDHTHIVTLFRSGYTSTGRRPFLVMEYLTGGSLQDRMDREGRIEWAEAVGLIRPIADALAFSHRSGILHKDVKPANILMSRTGVVKLGDFGIAAVKESTATSQVAYSLVYTAPETFDAYRDPATGELVDPRDERSDFYSLAATLYAMGTGQPAFTSPTTAGIMRNIMTDPVPGTGRPGLDRFLAVAMAKDPAERFPDAASFIAGLDRCLDDAGSAPTVHSPVLPPQQPGYGLPSNPASTPPPTWGTPGVVSADHGGGEYGAPTSRPAAYPSAGTPPPIPGVSSGEPTPPSYRQQAPQPPGPPPASIYSGQPPQSPPGGGAGSAAYPYQGAVGHGYSSDPNSHTISADRVPAADRPNSRRTLLVVVASIVAAFAVIAAGVVVIANRGDDETAGGAESETGTDDGAGTTEPVDEEAAAEDEPAGDDAEVAVPAGPAGAGGELRLVHWQAPSTANPYLAGLSRDRIAASFVVEPLARFTPDGKLEPTLAVEVPTVANGGISADRLSITWELRDDVVWSDGTPFTADDVAFTWEYCVDVDTGCTNDFSRISRVDVVDDTTVTLVYASALAYPYIDFVGWSEPILQRAQFAGCVGAASIGCASQNQQPIGTGPYVITSFQIDSSVTYEWNPSFRGVAAGQPHFETVSLLGGGDATGAATAVLQAGTADYAWNTIVDTAELELLLDGGDGRALSAPASNVEHINLNQTDPAATPPSEYGADGSGRHPILYGNFELARALSLAIDRDALVDAGYGPSGIPVCSMWPVGDSRSTTHDWCLTRDVDAANAILDELGYGDSDGDGIREFTDGTPLEFTFATSVNDVRQNNQEIIQANWQDIGVATVMSELDAAEFFAIDEDVVNNIWQFRRDMQMFTNGSASPDAGDYLKGWLTQETPTSGNGWAGFNIPRTDSATFDELWAELGALDPSDPGYDQAVIDLQDALIDSGSIIPLVHRANVSTVSNSLGGVGELNGWDTEYWNIHEWTRS